MRKYHLLVVLLPLLLTGCTMLPDGVAPVSGFKLERYLGTWYEIARLDHSFERGLTRVSATYTTRADGGIDVINKGYDASKDEFRTATGKAYFVADPDDGHLKVSFFGPFYGSYAIFELDHENYQYAFVSGYNKSYLWLLSRQPHISDELFRHFVTQAQQLGFDVSQLIHVHHP